MTPKRPGMVRHEGRLPSGCRYLLHVPSDWNGVLVLVSRPVPVSIDTAPWSDDEPLMTHHLVDRGYAVAGSANTIFWPLETAFSDQPALLEIARGILGPLRHTIAFGMSIGGIISAGLVQRIPDQLSGALVMCANLAGGVAVHNTELDIGFVFKTLLAPDSGLQLTGITDPLVNIELALTSLDTAQRTAPGRARLALAAAVGDIPGWHDPASPAPASEDFATRQHNQFAWFRTVSFLVYFWAREQVERQAGGNPSWNRGVDYRDLLSGSINRDEVEALYEMASLDLDADLERLAAAPRIDTDPEALAYLERHIVFSGKLGSVPVVCVHGDGDGLVTPGNASAYADVVDHAGHSELVRQLWVHRGGHCSFSPAEILTAFDVLVTRLDNGAWPGLDPRTLNAAAEAAGPQGPAPGFFDFTPPAFPRRYDVRDAGTG